ncbi:MAG TPA: hypothetical protein VMW66_02725, partial [Elusimicrobiales bacterium]|nr:hypothetical protein [Elusimicrobiales bacterium]
LIILPSLIAFSVEWFGEASETIISTSLFSEISFTCLTVPLMMCSSFNTGMMTEKEKDFVFCIRNDPSSKNAVFCKYPKNLLLNPQVTILLKVTHLPSGEKV